MVEIEKWHTTEITCPYCGSEWTDSWECDSGDLHSECNIEDCDGCGKKFTWNRNTEITYTSKGLCEENKTKHKFNEWHQLGYPHEDRACRTCQTCGKFESRKHIT